jgi:hypothetical protein
MHLTVGLPLLWMRGATPSVGGEDRRAREASSASENGRSVNLDSANPAYRLASPSRTKI